MLGVFLDIETTGLDPGKHYTIDIAFKIVDMSENKVIESYQSVVKQPREAWNKRDPISIKINGYTWEQLQQGKEPELIAQEMIAIFKKYDIVRGKGVFICQNPAFDRVFLTQLVSIETQEKLKWPYHWLDLASMFWALTVQRSLKDGVPIAKEIILSKNEIARSFNIKPEPHPHLALNGVDHLIACYQAVFGIEFLS